MSEHPKLSIIIPVLNEAALLSRRLGDLAGSVPQATQMIVVDGGSADGSLQVAAEHATVLASPPGRAVQLNRGAAAATGEVLLFLHVDVALPEDWFGHVRAALADPRVVGGSFLIRAEPRSPSLDIITALSNFRSRFRRRFYGDQAIFVEVEAFVRVGGFDESLPLMEGYDLTVRLKRLGRIACVPFHVRASSRRFLDNGVWRTFFTFHWLKLRYLTGRLSKHHEHLYPPNLPEPRTSDTRY